MITYERIMRFVTFQTEPHRDAFEPVHEPAKSIYLALRAETKKRNERPLDYWIAEERTAVFNAAVHQATVMSLPVPTMKLVERAEKLAYGHVGYESKWALYLADLMQESVAAS